MRRLITLFLVIAITSTVRAQTAPPKPWNSSLGAGLALTSGNSDTRNFNFAFNTVWELRRGPRHDHCHARGAEAVVRARLQEQAAGGHQEGDSALFATVLFKF